jgi:glycosyltransferase involved in cell wall biosynthesis
MRIVLDLQGCQSSSRLRGIGRYSLALAQAIARNAGEHEVWVILNNLFPESIEGVRHAFDGLLPEGRIAVFSVPPFALYQGMNDWRTRAAHLIREYAIAELEPDLLHVSSLFEGFVDTSVSTVKELDRDAITAVTLYDLIPYLNPRKYLSDAGTKKHYYGKIEALKRADVLLAISAYCGEEAVLELGIPAERITNISSAVSESFAHATSSPHDVEKMKARFGIKRPFVMTTGIVEPRKNLEGLIAAYGKLPVSLRRNYQLFMLCQATDADRTKLYDLAQAHGLTRDELVLSSGYVSDEDLVALYGACYLFVFPSLHEGFGLPALEAMACGAVVIGSSATSIPEVIGRDDALFDPLDFNEMATMMERGLTDTPYRQSLREHAALQVPKFSWDATGQRALKAFEAAYAQKKERQGAAASRSADERYRALIDALTHLEAKPTDADLVASADAIAANQRSGRPRQLLIDVSVLSDHDAKSGIQRVTRAIVQQLLEEPPAGWEVRPVRLERGVMAYRYADKFARSLGVGANAWNESDELVDSQQGDIFLGLDLVADRVPQAQRWFEAQRNRGVKIYFVIYDLLPVLRREWFHEGIAAVFPPWLKTIATVSDGLVCISRAVADDLYQWLQESSVERLRALQISYFHLGADIESSKPSSGMPDDAPRVLAALRERPTLVMVGTVEPRKGHVQAFDAFQLLWAANVDVNLVIVGKAGWGVGGLPDLLKEAAEHNERFFWLQGISDEYLEKIYGASSGLLAASLGEGFGLPLIEAAQKGLPIVARELPVFREVAGDHAFYFEGDTPAALADAIQKWLGEHAAGRARSSANMPWMTWKQSAKQLSQVILGGETYKIWRSETLVKA